MRSGTEGVEKDSPCGSPRLTTGGALTPTAPLSACASPMLSVTEVGAPLTSAACPTVYSPPKSQPLKSVSPLFQKCLKPTSPLNHATWNVPQAPAPASDTTP